MKARSKSRPTRRKIAVAKKCFYCTEKKDPWYSKAEILQRFMAERGKILGRSRTGICAKHQRKLTLSIKHARHLALLPFVVRV